MCKLDNLVGSIIITDDEFAELFAVCIEHRQCSRDVALIMLEEGAFIATQAGSGRYTLSPGSSCTVTNREGQAIRISFGESALVVGGA
jgi:hypothetical protein